MAAKNHIDLVVKTLPSHPKDHWPVAAEREAIGTGSRRETPPLHASRETG
jgi:hypothetical protein